MRLVSYNILNGGEGRADPLAEVLEAQRPDVVVLIEADVPTVVDRIAGRLAMDFIVGSGRGHSVALLSRWPIVESIDHAGLNRRVSRCLVEAVVRDPAGNEIPIAAAHLSAGAKSADEQTRMGEVALMVDLLGRHRQANRPHLLCGDFNSNAPYQQIEPRRCSVKTQRAWEENGHQLPRRVIQSIIDAGYTDTYAELHNENVQMKGSFDTQNPGQRVDYIFAFNMPAVKAAWVEQDRLAKYASDHFPIGVEL